MRSSSGSESGSEGAAASVVARKSPTAVHSTRTAPAVATHDRDQSSTRRQVDRRGRLISAAVRGIRLQAHKKVPKVLIAGGGVAGVEATLALAEMAADLTQVTLLSPEDEFVVRPLTVEEPFTARPAERHPLRPMLVETGVEYVRASLR